MASLSLPAWIETPARAQPAPPAPEAPGPLRPVPFDAIPGWDSDRTAEILPLLLASCRAFAASSPGRSLGGSGEVAERGGSPEDWQEACAAAARLPALLPRMPRNPGRGRAAERARAAVLVQRNEAVRSFLEERFVAHAAGEGLLTGYYEPILRGAITPGGSYATPLYTRPPELVDVERPGGGRRQWGQWQEGKLVPLPDRAGIETGALAGRGLELVWVEDAAEAFFLHIQGSGRVVLPNGAVLRLGYAGQNGQPYRAIGRPLIERGEIPRERMSSRNIREWMLQAGPEAAAALRRENPSYIFFRRVEGLRDSDGPIGAFGVPLTPERSLAVDPAFIPLGAPVFIRPLPAGEAEGTAPPAAPPAAARGGRGRPRPAPAAPAVLPPRLTIAQDTGGAIRGPARGDLFRGWGTEAGERAGTMRGPVAMWVLLPRPKEEAERPLVATSDPPRPADASRAPPRPSTGPAPASGTPRPPAGAPAAASGWTTRMQLVVPPPGAGSVQLVAPRTSLTQGTP
ncbi:MltA domain-containing protein [Roseomonas sp. OT10]|uniref:murein transglycosylase A n=1 Tax=Roseomonas cutis TaxID=2897332 RepID=UPI001E4A89D6|nr:MltA domain-containing protein [Roseomonas sp. OT10]UFN48163.1 MltA domain-containing protein [Roseomonas sp. OT10]